AGESKPQALPLQRAVADLASAAASAGGSHAPLVLAAVEAFRSAEAGLAADKAASSGYTAVCLDESWRAYCDVVQACSPRGGGRGGAGGRREGCWPALAAACHALADTLNRALQAISANLRGPALRQAEDLLRGLTDSPLPGQLCAAVEDARADARGGTAAEAAAQAALRALAAAVYCPATPATSSGVAAHFPLGAALAAASRMGGGGGASDRGMDTDAALPYAVRRSVGEALAASPGCVAALVEWAQAPPSGPGAGGGMPGTGGAVSKVDLYALQLLLQSGRACPALCQAAVLAGAPEGLMGLRDGPNGALALLGLTALLEGLHSRRGAPQGAAGGAGQGAGGGGGPAAAAAAAAQNALTPGSATDEALRRLAGMLTLASGDNLALGYVAAGAAAAYLRFYAQPAGPGPAAAAAAAAAGGGGGSSGLGSSRPLPPPPELLSPSRLASLVRLMKYHPAPSGAPALEGLEGAPARTGLFDGVAQFAALLLSYGASSDPGSAALQAGLGGAVVGLLAAGGRAGAAGGGGGPGGLLELSPRGFVALLEAAHHTAAPDAEGPQVLASPAVLGALVAALGERHQAALAAWPAAAGGGRPGAAAAALHAVDLMGRPLTPLPGGEGVEPSAYQDLLAQDNVMLHLVRCLDSLEPGEELLLPANLASRLVLSNTVFAQQFIAAGGLAPSTMARCLAEPCPPAVLVDVLLIVSQLARLHKDAFNTYEPLARANIYAQIRRLLSHPDAAVRSRVCNLVGNMCRHSAFFYGALERHGLLPPLIERCADADKATRKFACFAIGNAGFHNASLYGALEPAISPLVALLRDEEDKTRANAAGALGNLVRNSSALCGELIRAGALRALLETATAPERAPPPGAKGGGGGADAGGSPVKIALFSLGNMCAHRECRESLLALGVQDVIRRLSSNPDPTQQKYLQRIQQKLQAGAGQPGAGAGAPGLILAALPRNVIACLRLVDKATAALVGNRIIKIAEGVPGWAVASHLTRKRREFTLQQRRQLLGAVAAFGDVAWLERAAEAADCALSAEVMAAAAGAGMLACCQQLRAWDVPYHDGGVEALAAAASAGQREACDWLLSHGAEPSAAAAAAAAKAGHAALSLTLWERHAEPEPNPEPSRELEPEELEDWAQLLQAAAHGCNLAVLQLLWSATAPACIPGRRGQAAYRALLPGLYAAVADSPGPDWQAKLAWAEAQVQALQAEGAPAAEAAATRSACRAAASEAAARCAGPEAAVQRLRALRSRGYHVRTAAVVAAAAECGNLGTVTWLRQRHAPALGAPVRVLALPPGVALAAAVPALEAEGCRVDGFGTALAAITRGDKDGLAWVLQQHGAGVQGRFAKLLYGAVRQGRIDMLDELRSYKARTKRPLWSSVWESWDEAAAAGSEAVMEWLEDAQCPRGAGGNACVVAALNGDYATLRALIRQNCSSYLVGGHVKVLIEKASRRGPYRPASTSPLELLLQPGGGWTWKGLEEALSRQPPAWGALTSAKERGALVARARELRAEWEKEQDGGGAGPSG
ncbi:hypothetical protein HYH03_008379, partial [Edaphochlamys debaryana]